jgi:hypothetical protein
VKVARTALLVLLLALPALAGCFGEEVSADVVIPYPRLGDVATYAIDGAYVEFARWENGHALQTGARARFTLAASEPVIDGARAIHPAFRVTTELAEAGGFVKQAERFVSPEHQGVIQGWYPLSQDQAVLSFDERGFPWLFGASPLFGAELSREPRYAFTLPDNLGRGQVIEFAWVVAGTESVQGVEATKLVLEGPPSLEGVLWMEPTSAWPLQARLTLKDAGLAPHVRADGAYPVTLEARRTEVQRGTESLPPRHRAATFAEDLGAERVAWDGQKPPDGAAGQIAYALADAVRDATLLDKAFSDWLAAADDPRLYRGTYQNNVGEVQGNVLEGTTAPSWLIQFVSRDERYYEVEVERFSTPLLAQGVPRVNRSNVAEPPIDENHGWFAAADAPDQIVPLAEGVRIMRDVFGAPDVQIFLRSLMDPAGYSYYIDGGFEQEGGRYTVVYDPNTAFIQEATGPVTPRFAQLSLVT